MWYSYAVVRVVPRVEREEFLNVGVVLFSREMDFLGALSYDDEVWRAVRRRRPVLVEKPQSRIAQDFASVANELLFLEQQRTRTA